jgi:hypothetical protein
MNFATFNAMLTANASPKMTANAKVDSVLHLSHKNRWQE